MKTPDRRAGSVLLCQTPRCLPIAPSSLALLAHSRHIQPTKKQNSCRFDSFGGQLRSSNQGNSKVGVQAFEAFILGDCGVNAFAMGDWKRRRVG